MTSASSCQRDILVFLFVACAPVCAQTTYTKANNTTALDQSGSWLPSGVPGAAHTVRWDGTYTNGAASIGAGLAVNRVQVQSPSVAISINSGTGPLTVGSNGLDLSVATQNLTIGAPVVLTANQTWNVGSGIALTLNGGVSANSTAHTVQLSGNGTLTFGGASSEVKLAAGSHTFGRIGHTSSSNGTLVLNAAGATVSLGKLGYSTATGWTTVLRGGAWTIGDLGINSTGSQNGGTFRIEAGANVSITSARYGAHGTWLVGGASGAGNLTFASGLSAENGGSLGFVVRALDGGSVSLPALTLAQPHTGITTANELTVSAGGLIHIGGNLNLGDTATGKTETDLVQLTGGTLRVAGTLQANASIAGQTRRFNWSGGRLVAAAITPSAGFASPAVAGGLTTTSLLHPSGALLSPGDLGVAGLTVINGNYTQSADAVLEIDLGGATQAAAYQNGQYDHLLVTGGATLGGELRIRMANGFKPTAAHTFTVLAAGSISGDFANAPSDELTRVDTFEGDGSFLVRKEGGTIVLTGFRDNRLPTITAQPEAMQAQHGTAVSLSVSVFNPQAGGLTYQWYRNGAPVAGATAATLSFPSLTFANDGEYTVAVTNIEGTITSAPAYLAVVTPILMHYRMDQTPTGTAGTITDATGNTTGSIVGTPLPALVVGANATTTGSGWDFSQTDARLSISSTKGGLRNFGNLRNGLGLTIAFWYKPNAPITDYRHQNTIARFGKHFWIDFAYPDPYGTVPRFNFGDGESVPRLYASASPRGTNPLATGEWHFYAITLDYGNPIGADGALANNVVTYLNAQISGGYPMPGPQKFRFFDSFMPEPDDVFQLGVPNGQRQLWDNFMIFNYPLTQAEITQLHSQGALAAHAPQLRAWADSEFVVAPASQLTLNAEVSNFGQALPVTTTWSVTKAPAGGSVTFANPSALSTTATFSALAGDYVLALTANNTVHSSTRYVRVTVLASLPLQAFAAADGRPDAPVLTGAPVALSGASRLHLTPNPTTATYLWTMVSGPAAPVFVDATNPETSVSFTAPGTYVLRLTVTASGSSSSTDVTVRVFDEMITQVHGTASQQIMLWPANSTTLTANVTQTNPARPVTYAWSQVKGPGTTIFANPSSATTQATFSAPGVYQLRVAASSSAGSGEASVWVNVWPPGQGNEVSLLPPQPRQYKPQPPPYVHPRLLFTEADRPEITARTQNDPLTVAAVAKIRANVTNSIYKTGDALASAYQRLLVREPGYSVQTAIKEGIYDRLAEAAYLAWLDQDAARSREIGTVLTNALRDELTWNTTANGRTRIIGIAYDLVYNALNEEQRAVCRAYLGPLTAIAPAGFQFIDQVYGASMAIYGEPGYDEAATRRTFEMLRGAFEDNTYTTPQGWKQEDPAYGAFTGWGINPAAHMYRQIEPLIVTGNVARENLMEFYLLFADTTATTGGGMGGHSEGGWGNSGQQYLMHKYFYPMDPIEDFVRTANRLAGKRGDDLYEAIFAMSPITPSPTFASAAAARATPLARFDAQRGIGLARSDWGPNAVQLDHDIRRWWGGHTHGNVNDITLFANGRRWFRNPGYGVFANERHSTILINGIGSGRNPGRILDAIDCAPLTFYSGDAQHAYTYAGTLSKTSTSGGVTTSRTWRDMMFPGSSDGMFPPAIDIKASWADNSVRVSATNGVADLLNPVQRAFRTSTMVRGAKPYVLVFDDIQKDTQLQDYTWITNLPTSVDARPDATDSEAVLYHAEDGSAAGVPQLLVRVISSNGTGSPITVGTSTYNGQTGRRLHIPRRAVAPDFKILLFPHMNGEAAPTSSLVGNTLTVSFAEYTDRFTLQTTADGRTRIIGFSRSLPGRSGPAIVTPTGLQATSDGTAISPLTGQPGAVVTFSTSATSDTGAPLATTAQLPSGSVFPAGESLVYVSATDAQGQITWSAFPVTVVPPAPVARVEAVSNFPGATSGINLAWDKVFRATAYSVKRATNPAGPYTVVSDRQTGITFAEAGLPEGLYYYAVTSWFDTQEGPPSAVVSSRVSLGSFTAAKLGTATAGAGAYREGDSLLLCGTAGSLATTPDDHVFASVPWSGDGVFTARVASLTPFNGSLSAYAIYGIMARSSNATNSAHVTSTYSSWSRPGVLLRSTTGGGLASASVAPSGAPPRPVWVQLRREGNQFTTFFSTDGVTWQPSADPVTVSLPGSFLVGPVVAPRSPTIIHAARYDSLIFMSTPALTLQSNSIKLDWTALAGPSFEVQRATAAGGPYESIAGGLSSPTYTDLTVRQGVTYFYRVVGSTVHGGNTVSPVVSHRFPKILAAPTNVTIAAGNAQFTLGWSAVAADDPPTYAVERAFSAGGPYTTIANGLSGTSYTDTGLTIGTTYYYRIVTEGSDVPAISAVVSGTASSGMFTKANNTTALDLAASWSPAEIPSATDTIRWDGTYGTSAVSVGAGLAVNRVQLLSPSNHITISAGTGPLTLGSGGFDLSAATKNLTVGAPVVLSASQTWSVASGVTLALNGGVSANNPAHTVQLAGAGALTFGGNSSEIRLAPGSHTFGRIGNTSTNNGTLVLDATNATIVLTKFGYSLNTGWTTVLRGGTWTIGDVGINSTGSQNGGTFCIEGGANVSITSARYGAHGTWLVGGERGTGTLVFGSNLSPENGGSLGFVVRVADSGSATFSGLTLGQPHNNITTANELTVSAGGLAHVGNNLTLGDTSTGKTEANFVYLSGGVLRVAGTLQAATARSGQTRRFEWSGGRLVAGTITPSTGFDAHTAAGGLTASGLVHPAGATLAPGNQGIAGRTVLNGTYTQSAASAVLDIDIGGTTQATSYQTGQYDYLSVTGAAALGGDLKVRLIGGFTPASGQSFTVLRATGGISGWFANAADGGRIATESMTGSFLVTKSGNDVILSDYQANTPLESWRLDKLGTTSASGNTANDADPDGDGLTNLMEYSINSDPLVANPAAATTVSTETVGADAHLQISFLRARSDINYQIEASSTLLPGSWTVIATNPGTVGEEVVVGDPEPLPPGARRFLRLRVTVP